MTTNEVLLRYSGRQNVKVVKRQDSTLLTVTKADLKIDVDVPNDILEWTISVKDLNTNADILADWMEHYDLNNETKKQLEIERDEELEQLLQALLDTDIRINYVPVRNWFFWSRLKPILEHQTASGWKKILPF